MITPGGPTLKRAIIAVGLLASFAFLAPAGSALAQTGGVRGKVVDTDEAPVAEALVVVEFGGGMTLRYELQTNEKGEYIQMGLKPGAYRINASKEGFQPAVIEVTVGLGSQWVPDIVLTPGRPGMSELREKFAKGVELAQPDHLDEAEATFKEILEDRPEVVEVHQNLAHVYVKKQDWASAEASYLAALDLRPGSSELLTALARMYQDSGEEEKAMEVLSQVEDDGTAGGRAQFNKGMILLNAGNSEEAQTAFGSALAADPPVAEAHYYLGTILVGQGKVPEAVEHLETYLASNPADGPNKETALGLLEALK